MKAARTKKGCIIWKRMTRCISSIAMLPHIKTPSNHLGSSGSGTTTKIPQYRAIIPQLTPKPRDKEFFSAVFTTEGFVEGSF